MNRGTLIILLVFLALGAGAFWVMNQEDNSGETLYGADNEFAIKNIDDIGKIFMVDRDGKSATLERKGEDWIVNGKFKARENAMKMVLYTIRDLRVKYTPSKAAEPNIIRTIAADQIKVEVYDKAGNAMKKFYVGRVDLKGEGTAMIMEDADQPYMMHIQSLKGDLRPRFMLNEKDLRDNILVEFKEEDIKYMSVEYPKQKNKSFILESSGQEKFEAKPFHDLTPKINKKTAQGNIQKYFFDMGKIHSESFVYNDYRKDSIKTTTLPFCNIKIKNAKEEEINMAIYPFPQNPNATSPTNTPRSAKVIQRYYIIRSQRGHEDLLTGQQHSMKKLFWGYDFFF